MVLLRELGLSCCAMTLVLSCFGQAKDIEVTTSNFNESRQEYEINIRNNTKVYRTVILRFTTLSSLEASRSLPAIIEVPPLSSRKGLTLKKSGTGNPRFNYTYIHYRGCAKPVPDEDIIYALPVANRKKTKPMAVTSLGNYLRDDEKPADWNAVGFKMKAGDTVFCSRRGKVETVLDDHPNPNKSFSRQINHLRIRHEDCTYAEYKNFAQNQVFVEEGQQVEVGDPLGIVNPAPYGSSVQARVIFYTIPIEEQIRDGKYKMESKYFPVTFRSQEGIIETWDYQSDYVGFIDESMITQEMSKREIKKREKSKK